MAKKAGKEVGKDIGEEMRQEEGKDMVRAQLPVLGWAGWAGLDPGGHKKHRF